MPRADLLRPDRRPRRFVIRAHHRGEPAQVECELMAVLGTQGAPEAEGVDATRRQRLRFVEHDHHRVVLARLHAEQGDQAERLALARGEADRRAILTASHRHAARLGEGAIPRVGRDLVLALVLHGDGGDLLAAPAHQDDPVGWIPARGEVGLDGLSARIVKGECDLQAAIEGSSAEIGGHRSAGRAPRTDGQDDPLVQRHPLGEHQIRGRRRGRRSRTAGDDCGHQGGDEPADGQVSCCSENAHVVHECNPPVVTQAPSSGQAPTSR
jgi:hypothetical protein